MYYKNIDPRFEGMSTVLRDSVSWSDYEHFQTSHKLPKSEFKQLWDGIYEVTPQGLVKVAVWISEPEPEKPFIPCCKCACYIEDESRCWRFDYIERPTIDTCDEAELSAYYDIPDYSKFSTDDEEE